MTAESEGGPSSHGAHGHAAGSKWALMLGAVGVVYGDIGTSPQLGLFPRITIVHTSKESAGQIYIPEINRALMVVCLALVLLFRSSTALAAAYGIAVMGTMLITTTIFSVVVRKRWGWPLWKIAPLTATFLMFDLGFLSSTMAKLRDGVGGWAPLIMGTVVFTVMTTWKTGRAALWSFIKEAALPLQVFLEEVPPERRVEVIDKGLGIFQVIARYGFMQTPHVPSVMEACRKSGIQSELNSTSYHLGRETLLTNGKAKMARWRKTLFAFLSRNARPATAYFGLPPNRVVELGMQVDL